MEGTEKIKKLYEEMLIEDGTLAEATLTRQHFNALAAIMNRARTLDELMEGILDWLRTTNPLFDEQRFRKAAGM